MFRAILISLLFVLPASLLSADGFKYQKINQGDWAVVLVRGLNLDEDKSLNKVEVHLKLSDLSIRGESGIPGVEVKFVDIGRNISGEGGHLA